MTTLREAAQQALEALEAGPDVDPIFAGETEDALRAALAEPVQEPVAWVHTNGTSDTKWHPPQRPVEPVQQGCEHCNQPLYAAIKCRVCGRVTKPERNFCPRCGKRTQGIHTCTPPGDCDVHG